MGRGFGGAFSPLSLSPHLWLRFQDLDTLFTTSGGSTNVAADDDPIGRVEDKSGNGNHWTQATAGSRPLYKPNVVNESAVARFDGVDDFLDGPDLSALTAGEVFIIVKVDNDPPAAESQTGLWKFGTQSLNCHYPYSIFPHLFDDFGSNERFDTGDPAPSLAAWRLYNVVSVDGEWTNFIDGTQHFTTATNTVAFNSATKLGASNEGGFVYLDGDIAELVLFPRKLSLGEKAQMHTYFAERYALTIA